MNNPLVWILAGVLLSVIMLLITALNYYKQKSDRALTQSVKDLTQTVTVTNKLLTSLAQDYTQSKAILELLMKRHAKHYPDEDFPVLPHPES